MMAAMAACRRDIRFHSCEAGATGGVETAYHIGLVAGREAICNWLQLDVQPPYVIFI